jgi:hypothetical protein
LRWAHETFGFRFRNSGVLRRGGKWHLNLYDPDDTRVEFMEFTPVQRPSDYTGPHAGGKAVIGFAKTLTPCQNSTLYK